MNLQFDQIDGTIDVSSISRDYSFRDRGKVTSCYAFPPSVPVAREKGTKSIGKPGVKQYGERVSNTPLQKVTRSPVESEI